MTPASRRTPLDKHHPSRHTEYTRSPSSDPNSRASLVTVRQLFKIDVRASAQTGYYKLYTTNPTPPQAIAHMLTSRIEKEAPFPVEFGPPVITKPPTNSLGENLSQIPSPRRRKIRLRIRFSPRPLAAASPSPPRQSQQQTRLQQTQPADEASPPHQPR